MRIKSEGCKSQFDIVYEETIEHKCLSCGVNILDISVGDMWLSSWFYPNKASFRCCNCNHINTVEVEDLFKRFCMRSHTKSKNQKIVKVLNTVFAPFLHRGWVAVSLPLGFWINVSLMVFPFPQSIRMPLHFFAAVTMAMAYLTWRD